MVAIIHDADLGQSLNAERSAAGADKYDEVWDGVCVKAPKPNNEHQRPIGELSFVLQLTVRSTGLDVVFPGVNVSDRRKGWQRNYRCPDIAVFLTDGAAEDCGEFWLGRPDFATEVVRENDHSREKFPFYAHVGTRELSKIDRSPWRMTLFWLDGGDLRAAGRSTLDDPQTLAGLTAPLRFRMTFDGGDSAHRVPSIVVEHFDGVQRWTV